MQAQEVPPYGGQEQVSPTSPMDAEGGHKKKSVLGKVKDKAKKLKTKAKKPKSPGGTGGGNGSSSSDSSSEGEGGSDAHQQPGDERDVAVAPGVKGEAYDAIPDPHTDAAAGVGDKFGQMKLGDERDSATLKEEVPSAPGQASAGGIPVHEGKNAEGEDLVARSHKDKSKDDIAEGAAAAAATGAVAMGLKSDKDSADHDVNAPSITSRAADTVTGLKDAAASKLGYAPGGGNASAETTGESKSLLQTLQETAAGATAAISSKLGYGDSNSPSAQAGAGGDGKPYTQKVTEAAVGAKDAVASRLGYGGTAAEGSPAAGTGGSSYLQQARDTAISAKDAVASKVGYGSTDGQSIMPEGAANRFHPGEEDKALSMLITEKMSTGATAVKDTLMKPFAKSGPPTPTTDEVAGKATEDSQAQTPVA